MTREEEQDRYVKAIRNPSKRLYAERYLAWMRGPRSCAEPLRPEWLSYMAAQAVRIELKNTRERKFMTRDQAVEQVLAGLQYLILSHATSAASEQYAPSCHADGSDDHIREQKEWVVKVRSIRHEFENLVTGML